MAAAVLAGDVLVRAWVNGRDDLTGQGGPLSGGAYDKEQAGSGPGGAYVVVSQTGGAGGPVAESGGELATVNVSMQVYSLTKENASRAATALFTAVDALTGLPEPCGDRAAAEGWILVTDQVRGPIAIPQPGVGGEQFTYMVTADFMLAQL